MEKKNKMHEFEIDMSGEWIETAWKLKIDYEINVYKFKLHGIKMEVIRFTQFYVQFCVFQQFYLYLFGSK